VKRLLRILRGSAVVLSLLLFLTTFILWPRSYYFGETINYNRDGYDSAGNLIRRCRCLSSGKGQILISDARISSLMFPSLAHWHDPGLHLTRSEPSNIRSNPYNVWSVAGFAYFKAESPALSSKVFAIPHWALLSLWAIAPLNWLITRWRRRSRNTTACSTCGYDLRATPDRCPECGTAAALRVTASGQ